MVTGGLGARDIKSHVAPGQVRSGRVRSGRVTLSQQGMFGDVTPRAAGREGGGGGGQGSAAFSVKPEIIMPPHVRDASMEDNT